MSSPAGPKAWLVVALIVGVAFAGGAGLSYLQRRGTVADGVEGLLWPDPPTLAPLHLTDHDGRPFTLDRMRGRWSLLFFGFTHCPDVCPTTLDVMAQAQQRLRNDTRYGGRGQVVFVSVDPERDTPDVLSEYVRYFDGSFVGVTGSVAELEAFAARLGALFMKVPQAGAGYTIDHSAGIFFIDPELRLLSVITPPHSAAAIVARFTAVSAFIERS